MLLGSQVPCSVVSILLIPWHGRLRCLYLMEPRVHIPLVSKNLKSAFGDRKSTLNCESQIIDLGAQASVTPYTTHGECVWGKQ